MPLTTPATTLNSMGVNWQTATPAVDPYMVWAAISEFTGFDPAHASQLALAQITVETRDAVQPWTIMPGGPGSGPHAICTTEDGNGRIWTGDVDGTTLRELLTRTVNPLVAIELHVPRVSIVNIWPHKVAIPVNMTSRSIGSVIAVIDHGCPFAHRQFLQPALDAAGLPVQGRWRTRVLALWDQDVAHTVDRQTTVTTPAGASLTTWREVAPFGYGREMTSEDMDGLIDAFTQSGVVDEDGVYRHAEYDDLEDRATHGAHVMDLACGELDPMTRHPDHASEVGIIFVQLPRNTIADTSGGSMTRYVLDALSYIIAKTDGNVDHLAINLSYGATGGAHDGSSLLERGIDLLIQQARDIKPNRKIEVVIAAGNHILRKGHAQVRLTPAAPDRTLYWDVMPDDWTDSYLELWYAKGAQVAVQVSVTSPSGHVGAVSTIGSWQHMRDTDGGLCGALVHSARTPSGDDKAMALIALRPTHVDMRLTAPSGMQQVPVEHGLWRIDLSSLSTQPVVVDAWVQRDDALPWQGGQPQSRLWSERTDRDDDEDDTLLDAVKRRTTGSSVASGRHSMVVGAYVQSDQGLSRYTAAGPTYNNAREAVRIWPDCVAPADESYSLPGILAAGTRSGVLVRMNGTSVAAPQIARALINWWCDGKTPPIPVGLSDLPQMPADLRRFRSGAYRHG